MSVYGDGTGAYRDTAKWLAAVLPAGAVFAGTFAIGPGLTTSWHDRDDASSWFAETWLPLVVYLAAVVAVVFAYWRVAQLLAVQPDEVAKLLEASNHSEAATALVKDAGGGLLVPWFSAASQLREAYEKLADLQDDNEPYSELQARVAASFDVIREWSMHRRAKTPFRRFLRWFAVSVVLLGAASVVGLAQRSVARISEPTTVTVSVTKVGAEDLVEATGCTDPTAATFTAVAGTWQRPQLEVDGAGCRFGAQWRPEPSLVEVRPSG